MVKCLFLMILALVVLASSAHASSAWVKRCEGAICEMVQRLMDQDSRSRVLEMAIGFPNGGTTGRGVLILPLGVDLSQDFTMAVDDNPPLGFKIRYCLIDGCYAFLTLPPDVLGTMKKGHLATLEFKTFDGQPGKLPLSLEGFSQTLSEVQK